MGDIDFKDTVRFEPVKERRDGYVVEYRVPIVGARCAMVSISFLRQNSIEQVAKVMEDELDSWVKRYRVPAMAMAFDDTDSVIRLEPNKPESFVVGWLGADGVVRTHWGEVKSDKRSEEPFTIARLIETYPSIHHTISTAAEKRQKSNEMILGMKILRAGIILWIFVIPVGLTVLGYFNLQIGTIATVASVLYGFWKLAGVMGWRRKSEYQLKKEAEELRMKHHHYWCERNPEGFNRLKFEAMDRETRERVHEEAAAIERKSE